MRALLLLGFILVPTFAAAQNPGDSSDLFPDPSKAEIITELAKPVPGGAAGNEWNPQPDQGNPFPPTGDAGQQGYGDPYAAAPGKDPNDPFGTQPGQGFADPYAGQPGAGSPQYGSPDPFGAAPPMPSPVPTVRRSAAERLEDFETALSGPPGSVPATGTGGDATDLLLLNVEMNEALLTRGPSAKNAVKFVQSVEKFLNPRCMPNLLGALSYQGSPTDPKCLEYMDRLLKLQPSNPVGICARDGIDAVSCREAYSKQKIEISNPWAKMETSGLPASISDHLANGYSAADSTRMEKLGMDLTQRINQLPELTDPEARYEGIRAIRKLGEQYIRIACAPTVTIFNRTFGSDSERDSQKYLDELRRAIEPFDPFTQEDDILRIRQRVEADFKGKTTARSKELFARALKILSGKDGPDVEYGDVERVRIISERCDSVVRQLQEVEQNSPSAMCGREGDYSPLCVDAVRGRKMQVEQELAQLAQLRNARKQQQLQQQAQAQPQVVTGPDGQQYIVQPTPTPVSKGFKSF